MLMCGQFQCPQMPNALAHRWPRSREIFSGREGLDGRQEVRVTGGQLLSSSKTSQGSGHRLESDMRQKCLPPLTSHYAHHLSPLFSLLPCRHTVHPSLFIFLSLSTPRPACPAAVFVQSVLLNWYRQRGDGCCVSQLGEMR